MSSQASPWLSYPEARRQYRAGQLTWEGYIDQLLSRCLADSIHSVDEDNSCIAFEKFDLFICYVKEWTCANKIADTSPIKATFMAYRNSTIQELAATFPALRADYAPQFKSSLLLLALQERNAEVFRFLLARSDVQWNVRGFEGATYRVDKEKHPEIWEIIEGSEFRKQRPWMSLKQRERMERWCPLR
ncbi:hypothetical protein B0A48_17345 [Cryoendolithus antarcticus]|uniref:Uncharacterized protein n=1 Tax=Cryoendolithus antarcticus TaxID=1507870 RepID=A0A1V8SC97_9PEZI|nr:hypothetical protein B0A48_17345 [Cryoendolithus antarcticus]